jgi:hypothetical protein
LAINYNGPVVWGVAVCVRAGMCFCKVPVNGRAVSRPDETVQIVWVDGQKVSCQGEINKWRCKNHDSSASAGSPIDFVSAAELVMVYQI